jgi:hypothetical protein
VPNLQSRLEACAGAAPPTSTADIQNSACDPQLPLLEDFVQLNQESAANEATRLSSSESLVLHWAAVGDNRPDSKGALEEFGQSHSTARSAGQEEW